MAIKYSKQKQNLQNQRVEQLQKELSELSEIVDKSAVSEDIHKMEKVKKELDKIYTYKCKGAYVRAREKWMEFGEKSTKYFFKREQMNGVKGEVQSRITINSKERIKISLQIGAKMMKIG